jgi:hypothetical protein
LREDHHRDAVGAWVTDSDCRTGCNVGSLAYCQKFSPATVTILPTARSPKPDPVWQNQGCRPVGDIVDGNDELVCCANSLP